jgi:hypothetical protein
MFNGSELSKQRNESDNTLALKFTKLYYIQGLIKDISSVIRINTIGGKLSTDGLTLTELMNMAVEIEGNVKSGKIGNTLGDSYTSRNNFIVQVPQEQLAANRNPFGDSILENQYHEVMSDSGYVPVTNKARHRVRPASIPTDEDYPQARPGQNKKPKTINDVVINAISRGRENSQLVYGSQMLDDEIIKMTIGMVMNIATASTGETEYYGSIINSVQTKPTGTTTSILLETLAQQPNILSEFLDDLALEIMNQPIPSRPWRIQLAHLIPELNRYFRTPVQNWLNNNGLLNRRQQEPTFPAAGSFGNNQNFRGNGQNNYRGNNNNQYGGYGIQGNQGFNPRNRPNPNFGNRRGLFDNRGAQAGYRPPCVHCGKGGHDENKCWVKFPEMRPPTSVQWDNNRRNFQSNSTATGYNTSYQNAQNPGNAQNTGHLVHPDRAIPRSSPINVPSSSANQSNPSQSINYINSNYDQN